MRMHRVGILVCTLATLGCGGGDAADDQATADSVAVAPAAPAGPQLADAEIAHVAVTANTIDVEAGELAKQKSSNAEVKQFAQTMITDHTGVNQQASALAQRLNLTPADNTMSQQLKSDADRMKAELTTRSGAEFDRTYIANEINYHQAVLNALDQTLIPGAQNAELKALLEKVRPAIQSHLEMAQVLQGKLAGGS
jgi:putative membrane protein